MKTKMCAPCLCSSSRSWGISPGSPLPAPSLHHYQKRLLAEVTGLVHPVVYWEILAELPHPLLPLQLLSCFIFVASPMAQWVKNLLAMQETQETWFWSLGWEDSLKEGMATHCSIFAWRISWTDESARLQSLGLQKVGHDWSYWARRTYREWGAWKERDPKALKNTVHRLKKWCLWNGFVHFWKLKNTNG